MTVTDNTPDTADVAPVESASAEVTAPSHGDEVIDEVIDEVLVEEISIDGMCGVY